MQIGDNVMIGEDCVVNASNIGAYVYVGRNCIVVSRRSLIKCQLVRGMFVWNWTKLISIVVWHWHTPMHGFLDTTLTALLFRVYIQWPLN